jgi:hypothetical protein
MVDALNLEVGVTLVMLNIGFNNTVMIMQHFILG